MELNKWEQRLLEEWIAHKKIIIAVDYDDTLYPYRAATQDECNEVISLMKWCKTIGCYLVVFTASDESRHEEIGEYCRSHNLDIDSINKNPINLPYGNEGKIYYNIFVCDRADRDGAMKTLENVAKAYVSYIKKNEKLDDIA